ncbi:MAG: hypothetical protein KDE54_12000 [Caldilineaceae bacterium]|nr:hypothetical protein [Caldilineaceae bacterium]MCB0096699.1 hypothetical protein [Caldilineaceae bacterium]MCB0138967.1 hypothetical protein [Caldilineaceae bacterium]MCB9151301.1 hypothetical protein [Caldilineaceae bacterium]
MKNGWVVLSGELQREMQLVYDNLLQMATELESPLRELVSAQVNSAQPYLRAGVVLAAGVDEPDSSTLQAARVHLATALEMLYVALSIHRLLLPHDDAARQADPNKTLLGSTILAGDYCFSQSAIMAARTENPAVVAIFAKALQDVSESQLRQVFNLTDGSSHATEILFEAGARAAAKLRHASASASDQVIALGQQFAHAVQSANHVQSARHGQTLDNASNLSQSIDQAALAAPLKQRWHQIIQLA